MVFLWKWPRFNNQQAVDGAGKWVRLIRGHGEANNKSQLWAIQSCHTMASNATINCEIFVWHNWVGVEWIKGINWDLFLSKKGIFVGRWIFLSTISAIKFSCFGAKEVVFEGTQQNWRVGTVAIIIGVNVSKWFGCRMNWSLDEMKVVSGIMLEKQWIFLRQWLDISPHYSTITNDIRPTIGGRINNVLTMVSTCWICCKLCVGVRYNTSK